MDEVVFPDYLMLAHDLCLLHHDVLLELLRAGEEKKIFSQHIRFHTKEDEELFVQSKDVFLFCKD